MRDRDIYLFTNSPPKQYSNSRIKITEVAEKYKHLNEYENDVLVSDDFLGTSISNYMDQFFIKGRHVNYNIYYL